MDDSDETDALHAARRRRRGVRAALDALESATASSIHEADWLDTLRTRLVQLEDAFDHHVAVTEGHDGLFEEVLTRAPRLARRTKLLQEDHIVIREAIRGTIEELPAMLTSTDTERAVAVREAVTDIMGRITRHRQLGADLVYEAYSVDIEAAD